MNENIQLKSVPLNNCVEKYTHPYPQCDMISKQHLHLQHISKQKHVGIGPRSLLGQIKGETKD